MVMCDNEYCHNCKNNFAGCDCKVKAPAEHEVDKPKFIYKSA